jgi:hypothetical protein
MATPSFKQLFKKFYGPGILGKTIAAVGATNQVTVAAHGTGRRAGSFIPVDRLAAQGALNNLILFQSLPH